MSTNDLEYKYFITKQKLMTFENSMLNLREMINLWLCIKKN
jgi:hypothetical protein